VYTCIYMYTYTYKMYVHTHTHTHTQGFHCCWAAWAHLCVRVSSRDLSRTSTQTQTQKWTRRRGKGFQQMLAQGFSLSRFSSGSIALLRALSLARRVPLAAFVSDTLKLSRVSSACIVSTPLLLHSFPGLLASCESFFLPLLLLTACSLSLSYSLLAFSLLHACARARAQTQRIFRIFSQSAAPYFTRISCTGEQH
jgi:hypothetical protein